MTTFNLDGIFTEVSEDFVTLSQRKRELDAIEESDDPKMMTALYDALAEDFEREAHYILAGNCRKHAKEWSAAA
jgi:hypothetical protein